MRTQSDVEVHFSELKRMGQSAAHCKAAMDAGRQATPSKLSMRAGSLVDAIAFGHNPYVVWPGRRAGKDWEKFEAENRDQLIVTQSEFDKGFACATALQSHREAMRVLDGERQRRIEWEWLGLKCASTLDIIQPGRIIADLKIARTTEPRRFKSACLFYAYHGQQSFYGRAAAYLGLGEHEHYIVGIEPLPPFAVTIFRVTPRALEDGEKLCRGWMERLKVCLATNEWPSYTQSIIDLEIDDEVELIFGDEETEAA